MAPADSASAYLRRIEELEVQVEVWRQRCIALGYGEEALGNRTAALRLFGFSPQQSLIVDLLMRRPGVYVHRDRIHHYAAGGRSDGGPDIGSIISQICYIRRRLSPHGVVVLSRHSVGYSMPLASVDRLKALISEVSTI